jgi:hypothetical protein
VTPVELARLEAFITRRLAVRGLALKPRPGKGGVADVLIEGRPAGTLSEDREDDELSYQLEIRIDSKPEAISPGEALRIQALLHQCFGSRTLTVRRRGKLKDTVDVYLGDGGDDFVATVSAGKGHYEFQMAIIKEDLDD